jgi:CRP-like cAMP-binding protein
MDNDQARTVMAAYLRETFGQVLELREVAVVRKASGRTWRGEVVCATGLGEIPIGHLAVHEDGRLIEACTVDDLVEGIRAAGNPGSEPPASKAMDLFTDLDLTGPVSGPNVSIGFDEDVDGALSALDDGLDLRERIKQLKSAGRREDLLVARDMLPQLLTDGETRRFTLVEMGEIELRLGNSDIALQYLEAAAREFADRSEVRALELVASIALRVLGEECFATSPVKQLLDLSRRRLRPIEHLGQAPVFAGLGQDEIEQIERLSSESTIEQGQVLLQEGAEAVRAYVVRSGILSIRLQAPDGGSRVVRCCFPGDLVGETSVLGEAGATCTATVRAECLTSVWGFRGTDLRDLGSRMPMVLTRLEGSRALRRLDSFFSMNETTQTLDARMRDRILACVTGLRRSQANELLNTPGEIPPVVYLVAEGTVEYASEDAPTTTFGSDKWIGLRDALHGLATEGTFVSAQECLLVVFDPERLRAFAAEAPPDVVSVFQRLD